MIGQASCDERGRYVGGQAGNQSGTELNAREAYLRDWHTLIRFNNSEMAAKCGRAMADAVANMNIGYDQSERNSILYLARAAGWRLAAIDQPCECDCSSLAGICAIAAGAPEAAVYKGGNLCYTGDIVERLEATGLVSVYGSSDYVKSTVKWQVGDILVSNTHAIVVIAGASAGNAGAASVAGDLNELARAVIAGRFGNGEARRAALGARYDEVQRRVNALLAGTPNNTALPVETPSIIGGAYKVVASKLHVRSTPSRAHEPIAAYARGDIIYGVSAYAEEAEGFLWAHYTALSGNRRYVAMGTSDGRERYLVKA